MPHSTVREFDDPFSYQAIIRNTDVEVFPTAKGRFSGTFTHVNFDQLWLQGVQESLPRVYVGYVKPARATIGFLANFEQTPIQHCGVSVRPGEIIFNNNSMMHRRTESPCQWGAMTLTPEDLAAISENIVGREVCVPLTSQIVRPRPELAAQLLHLHLAAIQLAKTNPVSLMRTTLARSIEHDLIVAMVKCLDQGAPAKVSVGNRNHSTVMKRLEEFLAANAGQPVYLMDICKATNASESVLRASCQESLGMRPMQYLWLRRMHLARRNLLAARIDTTSVTAVAMDNGFWELGRFAAEYRSLFGEPPSATLRKTAGSD